VAQRFSAAVLKQLWRAGKRDLGVTMISVDEFRRWFDYEQDAHRKTLESLRAAEGDRGGAPEFAKAVDIAAHVVAARMMWLSRMGGPATLPDTLFPRGTRLDDVADRFARMHAAWASYLAGMDDVGLNRVFEYHTYDGEPFQDTVVNVLTQLFGHSSYHRGQIALLLRGLGAEPAVTDFVFWTRQRIVSAS
jgi:uncharacterized damage-inducible protein DinB